MIPAATAFGKTTGKVYGQISHTIVPPNIAMMPIRTIVPSPIKRSVINFSIVLRFNFMTQIYHKFYSFTNIKLKIDKLSVK